VGFYYTFLLCMFAAGTVLVSVVAGLLMTVALLSIPSATANLLVKSLPKMMSLSSLLTFVFIIAGLFVSFQIDLPSGPTIVIISVLFYLLSILLTRCLLRPKT
jgi:zinc transport system permease protein